MTSTKIRTRLLSGAALGLGLTMIAASPAQAGCALVGSVLTCTPTTTTDTNYPANVPNDRSYNDVGVLTATG